MPQRYLKFNYLIVLGLIVSILLIFSLLKKNIQLLYSDDDLQDSTMIITKLSNLFLRNNRRIMRNGISTNQMDESGSLPSNQSLWRTNLVWDLKPRHILFTTVRHTNDSLREIMLNNSLSSIRYLNKTPGTGDNFIIIINFSADGTDGIRRNKFDTPILRSMFLEAMIQYPEAKTYTYFNGDLVFDHNWLDTVETSLIETSNSIKVFGKEFLLVGQRYNIPWASHHTQLNPEDSKQFDMFLKMATLYRVDAIDYFTFTANAWDWNLIPDFVIGRPAYDNWIIHHAWITLNPRLTVIDGTNTVPVLHQSLDSVVEAWKLDPDVLYNHELGKGLWSFGRTTDAPLYSIKDSIGNIVLCGRNLEHSSLPLGFIQPSACPRL
jgi:hypothetical protein